MKPYFANRFVSKLLTALLLTALLICGFTTVFAQDVIYTDVASTPLLGTNAYTVTFLDSAGNTIGAPVAVENGLTVGDLPDAPRVEGKTFSKWVDQNGAEVTASTVVTGDMTVTATYSDEDPVSSGNLDGAQGVLVVSSNGNAVVAKNAPTANCLDKKMYKPDSPNFGQTVWTFEKAEDDGYYYINSDAGYLNIGNGVLSVGSKMKIKVAIINGYLFMTNDNGYALDYSNKKKYFQAFSPAKNDNANELFSLFPANEGITIQFNENGGSIPLTDQKYFCYADSDKSFSFPGYDGTRDGYRFFNGWEFSKYASSVENGYEVGQTVSDKQLYEQLKGSAGNDGIVKLYAVWRRPVNVNFHPNGGDASAPESKSGLPGETVELPEYDGKNKDYRFIGWGTAKNTSSADAMAPETEYQIPEDTTASNITLWALWQPHVKITFDVTGGDVEVPDPITEYYPGDEILLPGDEDYPEDFVGWTDGEETILTGDYYTVPEKDTILYAVWESLITLTFDENGGSIKPDPETIVSFGGSRHSVPGYEGEKEGWEFLGWSDVKDLKDDLKWHKVYHPGETIILPHRNLTLYAVWNDLSYQKVQFGIRLDGTIPYEPGTYPVSQYTAKHIEYDDPFSPDQIQMLTQQQWVVDVTVEYPPEDQCYGDNNVTARLLKLPTASEIQDIVPSFDSETQYVHWYVIKWQGVGGGGKNRWHVDGVIKMRRPYIGVSYDGNPPEETFDTVDNLPRGYTMVGYVPNVTEHNELFVGMDAKPTGGVYKEPKLKDYLFKGWCVNSRTCSDPLPMEDWMQDITEDITFYAQWDQVFVNKAIKKVWNDDNNRDGIRPDSLKVKLYEVTEDGTEILTRTSFVRPNTDPNKDWITNIEHLPQFNADGNEITYIWKEELDSDSPYEQDGEPVTEDALTTITNKYEYEKVYLQVIKVWDDESDQDGKRSANLPTFTLTADGEQTETTLTAGVGENNEWISSPVTMPKFRDEGTEIVYSWTEELPADSVYSGPKEGEPTEGTGSAVVDGETVETVTFTFTNSYTPETAITEVSKEWDDDGDRDGLRPDSLTVTLYAGSESLGITRELSEDNDWEASYGAGEEETLPRYADGDEIEYMWVEGDISGYELDESEGKSGNSCSEDPDTGIMTCTTKLVNKHDPELTEATIVKNWNDSGQTVETHPSVDMTLTGTYMDDDGAEHSFFVTTETLTEETGWEFIYGDDDDEKLYMYQEGKAVTYKWTESAVSGYTASDPEISGTVTTITNTKTVPSDETYTLIVDYYYWDGNIAAERFFQDGLREGTDYRVVSPEISGYTASKDQVAGTMPARDVRHVVIYTAPGGPIDPNNPEGFIEKTIIIDDLETPLGLGEVLKTAEGDAVE